MKAKYLYFFFPCRTISALIGVLVIIGTIVDYLSGGGNDINGAGNIDHQGDNPPPHNLEGSINRGTVNQGQIQPNEPAKTKTPISMRHVLTPQNGTVLHALMYFS